MDGGSRKIVLLEEELDIQIISCAVCFERFDQVQRIPRTLLCLHTFCDKCIRCIKRQGNKLECPTCRDITDIPITGFEGLRVNFAVQNLVEMVTYQLSLSQTSVETKCTFCDSRMKAVHSCCADCEGPICVDCVDKHSNTRGLRNHSVMPVQEYSKIKVEQKKDGISILAIKCLKHPNKDLEFFCESCKLTICSACGLLDHSGHKMITLEEGAQKERSMIGEAQVFLRAHANEVEEDLAQLNAEIAAFARHTTNIEECILEQAQKIVAAVNTKCEAALVNLQAMAQGVTAQLEVQKNALENKLARIQGCAEYARSVVVVGSDVTVLEASQQLQQAIAKIAEITASDVGAANGAEVKNRRQQMIKPVRFILSDATTTTVEMALFEADLFAVHNPSCGLNPSTQPCKLPDFDQTLQFDNDTNIQAVLLKSRKQDELNKHRQEAEQQRQDVLNLKNAEIKRLQEQLKEEKRASQQKIKELRRDIENLEQQADMQQKSSRQQMEGTEEPPVAGPPRSLNMDHVEPCFEASSQFQANLFKPGDIVEALWPNCYSIWYDGKIDSVLNDGSCGVAFNDGTYSPVKQKCIRLKIKGDASC